MSRPRGRMLAILTLALLSAAAWLAWTGPRTSSSGRAEWAAAPDHSGRTIQGVVRAREADVWMLRFAGGQAAGVRVAGSGVLGCAVRDAGENLLAAHSAGGGCQLHFVPARTGSYQVIIRNMGSTASPYQLATE